MKFRLPTINHKGPARKCDPPQDMRSYRDHWSLGGQVPDLEGLPWWRRILCVLAYHDWEERHNVQQDSKNNPVIRGKLRDQCGHCKVLR